MRSEKAFIAPRLKSPEKPPTINGIAMVFKNSLSVEGLGENTFFLVKNDWKVWNREVTFMAFVSFTEFTAAFFRAAVNFIVVILYEECR